MKLSSPMILVVVLIALTIAGAAIFVLPSWVADDPAPVDAPPHSEKSVRENKTVQPTAPKAEAAKVSNPGPAFAAAMRALGLAGETPPRGQAYLIGRVVSPDLPAEADGPGAVPAAAVAIHILGSAGGIDQVPTQIANTREDGRFVAIVPQGQGYEIAASAPGFAEVRMRVAAADLDDGGESCGDIALLKSAQLVVKVTTGVATLQEKIEAVADLALTLRSKDGSILGKARTSKSGEARFSDLPRGSAVVVGERKPLEGFARPISIDRPELTLEINIQIVGSLRVRAKAPSGETLSNFAVALDIHRGRNAWMEPRFEDVQADASGFATLKNVKAGSWSLFATAEGLALGTLDSVKIAAGETTDAEVTLAPGYSISGQVVSKVDGRPVAGAVVFSEKDLIPSSVHTHTGNGFEKGARATRTNTAGRFTLNDLSAGSHDLSAVHEELAAGRVDGIVVGPEAKAGEEALIKLGPGCELSGHVYDPSGAPLEGVQVMVIAILDRNVQRKIPLMGSTDSNGFYHIARISPGTGGVLKLDPTATPPSEFRMTLFREGKKKVIDFGKAREGSTVFGMVTNRAGDPLAGVGVTVVGEMKATGGLPPMYQGSSAEDGMYRIIGIPKGVYEIHVSRRNIGGDFVSVARIRVPESGEERKDIELPEGTISGRVLSSKDGKPPHQGEVILLRVSAQGTVFSGRSELGRDGRYLLETVPEGRYILAVSAVDHQSKNTNPLNLSAGRQLTLPDIVLSSGGRLSGEVKDAAGNPVEGAQILLLDPVTGEAQPAWSFGTTAEGHFEAQSVPVGNYSVTARKTGLVFPNVPVQITAGATATVVILAQ